jgi:hypothetical protein
LIAAIATLSLAACGSPQHETYSHWRTRAAHPDLEFVTLNFDIQTALSDIGPGAAAVKCQAGLRAMPGIAKVLRAAPDSQLRGILVHALDAETTMLNACVKGDTSKSAFYTQQATQYLQDAGDRINQLNQGNGPTTTINNSGGTPTYPTPTCVPNTAGMNCA